MENPDYQLALLKEALLSAPSALPTRILAVAGSVFIVILVLALVRRQKLRQEYTPIWMALAFGTLLVSVWFDLLLGITRAIGAWTPSSTIFFLGVAFLFLICLNYAVRLSSLVGQVKILAQEVAILRGELFRAKREEI